MATSHDAGRQGGQLVEADGVTFYYQTHGQGQPLLLLHGGSLTGDMWRPYLAKFAERYRAVVPDMPSHGRSSSRAGALSYRQLADDIVAFARALDLDNPLIVGYSDGGQVALEIGMRYPMLPQSIVIGGVVSKYSDALRGFIRGAVGDERSAEADTELLDVPRSIPT